MAYICVVCLHTPTQWRQKHRENKYDFYTFIAISIVTVFTLRVHYTSDHNKIIVVTAVVLAGAVLAEAPST